MKQLIARLLCCFLAAMPLAASGQPQQMSEAARAAWGFDASDLTPHPKVRFGLLPNGMRYAIMRSDNPANGLSARLHFDAGAMEEGEGEQGYLHLIEHLIFHGSRNIPDGALPLMMAHRGMKRTDDFNAVTSYDETVYRLDLSQADHNARAAALMLMRDVADGLLFAPSKVNAAKRAVREEIKARSAVRDRIAAAHNAFLLPGSPLARGPVTGTRRSVRRAMPAALKRLYDRTYAPYRATFVLVGDFDPAVAEGEVGSFFSTWKAAAQALKAGAEALPASSTGNRGVEAFLFADRSAPTSVSIASFAEPSQDRASARDAQFLEQLATDMLSRRLALRASPAVARASAAIYTHFSMARLATLDVEAKDRDWRGALTFGGAQLHGALAHGFEQAELEAQLDVMREALRRAAAPRTSGALADAIVDAVGRKLVFTEAADPAASAAYLGKVRLDDVNAAFRQAWSNPARLIFVTHDGRVAGAEAAIIAAWSDSAAAVAGK